MRNEGDISLRGEVAKPGAPIRGPKRMQPGDNWLVESSMGHPVQHRVAGRDWDLGALRIRLGEWVGVDQHFQPSSCRDTW
jgi:hypothetical protein